MASGEPRSAGSGRPCPFAYKGARVRAVCSPWSRSFRCFHHHFPSDPHFHREPLEFQAALPEQPEMRPAHGLHLDTLRLPFYGPSPYRLEPDVREFLFDRPIHLKLANQAERLSEPVTQERQHVANNLYSVHHQKQEHIRGFRGKLSL